MCSGKVADEVLGNCGRASTRKLKRDSRASNSVLSLVGLNGRSVEGV